MKRLSQLVMLALITNGLVFLPACKEKAQQPAKKKEKHDDHDQDDNNNSNATGGQQTFINTGGTDPCLTNGTVPIGGVTSTFTGINTGLGTNTLIGGLTGTGTGIGLLGGALGGLAGQATNLGQLGGGGLDQLDDGDDFIDDDEGGFDLTGDDGLSLVGTVSYEGSIRLLLTAKCLSCHNGQKDPNLSTYLAARDNANDSMLLIDRDDMPRGNVAKLTPVEKQQFRDWVNGGLLERDSGATSTFTGIGTSTNTGGTTLPDPCGTNTTTSIETGDNADAWTAFLNPPEVASCHGQGKLYDRGTKACHAAPLATTYQCTRDGIIAKFQTLGLAVTADLDRLAGLGFEIDQCGEVGATDPIVMMYQRVDNGNELNLNLKRLCKNTSTLCQ